MSKFMDGIIAKAKSDKKTVVLAEGSDMRTIRAAAKVLKDEIANIIILGDESEIKKMAESENLDISAITPCSLSVSASRTNFIASLCEGMGVSVSYLSLPVGLCVSFEPFMPILSQRPFARTCSLSLSIS